jgi:polyisoprenoid-binding protein YceI
MSSVRGLQRFSRSSGADTHRERIANCRVALNRSRLVAVLWFGAASVNAQQASLHLDPASTKIEYTVSATLHTVHGTFALKSGTIHFDPSTGSASGLIAVDATSGNSGNNDRDHKMHKDILESERYPEVTFTPAKLSGTVALQGSSTVQLEGVLRLHGNDHSMTLPVTLQIDSGKLVAKTHIVIPYTAWGLKNPSSFLLHVSDSVEIDIITSGRMGDFAN